MKRTGSSGPKINGSDWIRILIPGSGSGFFFLTDSDLGFFFILIRKAIKSWDISNIFTVKIYYDTNNMIYSWGKIKAGYVTESVFG